MRDTNMEEMFLLTGKAKIDFEKWVSNEGLHEEVIYSSVINSLIIDWLDSVGIYVEVGVYPCEEDNRICFSGTFVGKIGGWDDEDYHKTRQQAVEKTIEVVNELYNKKFNNIDPEYRCVFYVPDYYVELPNIIDEMQIKHY